MSLRSTGSILLYFLLESLNDSDGMCDFRFSETEAPVQTVERPDGRGKQRAAAILTIFVLILITTLIVIFH